MAEERGLRWSADLRACGISAVEEVRDRSEATGGDFAVGLRVVLAVEGLEGGRFLAAKAGLVRVEASITAARMVEIGTDLVGRAFLVGQLSSSASFLIFLGGVLGMVMNVVQSGQSLF